MKTTTIKQLVKMFLVIDVVLFVTLITEQARLAISGNSVWGTVLLAVLALVLLCAVYFVFLRRWVVSE